MYMRISATLCLRDKLGKGHSTSGEGRRAPVDGGIRGNGVKGRDGNCEYYPANRQADNDMRNAGLMSRG